MLWFFNWLGGYFCKPFIFSTIHFLFLSQFYNFNFSQVLLEAMIEIETIFYFDYWSPSQQYCGRFQALLAFYFMTLFEQKGEPNMRKDLIQFSLHSIFMRTSLNWCYIKLFFFSTKNNNQNYQWFMNVQLFLRCRKRGEFPTTPRRSITTPFFVTLAWKGSL